MVRATQRTTHRAGVPLLVGTDTQEPQVAPGFALHQELEMLVESGLPPDAALRDATLHNATDQPFRNRSRPLV